MNKKLNGFNDGEHPSSGVGGIKPEELNKDIFQIPIQNTSKKVKITFKDEYWECGDKCCSDYFSLVFLNGEELEHPQSTKEEYMSNQYMGENVELTLEAVLKRLGFEVEIERINE